MIEDKDRIVKLSKEKMREIGIKDGKYEITVKFNEEDLYIIAATILLAPGFGYKDPAEFIKFILHEFNLSVADKVTSGKGITKKETLH